MNEKELFNQKLMEIGGGELLEGISIRGDNANKILDFINANTAYEYEIDANNMLKKVNDNLKNNSNLDKNAETFLDIEIQNVTNNKSKIILAFSQEEIEGDLEKIVDGNNRIILLNENSYTVEERYIEYTDVHDSSVVLTKDALFNEALSDRLIKSLHNHVLILTRSSTAIVGVMNADTNVQHGPSSKYYANVGSVDLNESVYILATSMGWYHIQYHVTGTNQQKTGYVPQSSISSISGGTPTEEDFYGGYCFATTELDVRTCDDFSITAPVGTLFKHEGCTFLFSYLFNGENIAFIEYSTSSGTKRGYVYSKYLTFPLETIVGVVKEAINVYGGPGSNFANIGSLGAGELISLLAKESNDIYVEYNTNGGRKRGYIKWDTIDPRDYTPGTLFADFYTNGTTSHIIDQRCVVYGGPNNNYAELGAVNNEEVTCFNTNKADTNQYTFEYTCIEYTVSSTGQRKRGYVLASQVIGGNLPEENNAIETFNESYSYFGKKTSYGTTQKGRNMFYYRAGSGPNHLFLVFAQHGWEDGVKSDGSYYHGDGNMLLKIAKSFINRFISMDSNNREAILKKWSIFVFPGVNLDGIVNGNSNNGFGRCFKNGIDPNRSWPGKFKIFSDSRNYTGNSYLGAQELVNLKNVLVANRGSGLNVAIDIHGWENSVLSANTELARFYTNQFGNRYKDTTYATTDTGYFITWARNSTDKATTSSDMPGLGARSALLELPPTTDYSDAKIVNDYGAKFFNGTINLLNNISGTATPEEPEIPEEPETPTDIKDVLTPNDKKDSLKSEIAKYVSDNMGLAAKKALRSREQAAEDTLSYDSIFTELSNRFNMRKALIETVAMWERACEGADDPIADTAVRNEYNWQTQVEWWYSLNPIVQAITPFPTATPPTRDDCSTGFAQIFASTAIKARNFARSRGLISDREYSEENWKDIWEIWQKLNSDVSFNLECCALTLLWGADDIGISSNPYNYTEDETKRVLARYNGVGEAVVNDYGVKNLGLYKIFERYNKAARE